MHYGAYAFAVDPSVPTIIVPDGVSIGQRDGFSDVIKYLIGTFNQNLDISFFHFFKA